MSWSDAQSTGVSYSAWITRYDPGDDRGAEGSAGVREPRRPRPNLNSGAVRLDVPPPPEAFDLGRELAARYGW